MSLIEKYELLKHEGSLNDRVKFILSLSDRTQVEIYLKESAVRSYDDLQMLVFLSKSTKNQTNLIEIFKTDAFPVHQRADAAKAWLRLQKHEKQIHQFVIETILDSNIPRLIKHQILACLHHIHCLKKSSSFFYNLACHLTESFHHDEYNIDAHTLPFCSSNQIIELLSKWSLTRFSQIYFSSPFRSKLIHYQPLIVIRLIKEDLINKYINNDTLWNYYQKDNKLLELLVKKEPKAMCHLAIELVKRLEKHKKILPEFIESQQEFIFDKAPDEMIELIILVASYQPGIIKYEISWDPLGMELHTFQFPSSFSIDHYIRLFSALYETCNWSLNNTPSLVYYMLSRDVRSHKISILNKQRKWFFDIIIKQRIGQEEFLNKLFKNGTEFHLDLFTNFPELSIPFARYLYAKLDQTELIDSEQRATFLRYELLTSEIFNQFLSIFQQNGSDANYRKRMYSILLQSAISTDQESVTRVLQWIHKRFINEQLTVIEYFLRDLSSLNDRFHLEYLSENFQEIEGIMEIAFNHLQRTSTIIEIILAYGFLLLIRVEHYQNKIQQEKIQEFACRIIKQYYSPDATFPCDDVSLSPSFPMARNLFANILISDIFPRLLAKCLISEINNLLMKCFHDAWRLRQIDLFLHSFFFEQLYSSTKLQSVFDIDEHSFLISLFLKSPSTRLERVYRLLNEIDQRFFLHIDVQRTVLCSQQYRLLINKLLEDEKCVDINKLSKEQNNLNLNLQDNKLPGFNINILNSCYYHLTGQQQEYITKIIRNDYLQDTDIPNLSKLKALRILRRLNHTYHDTLQWIEARKDLSDTHSSNCSARGANIQTINYYILSLPASFDLFSQELFKQFDRLKGQLNASNAIYVRDALWNISQKTTDQYFLKYCIELIQSEDFSKFGITANKAILRLLIQYRFNASLITSVLKPLWDSRPHPDIRACLVMILLNFIHKSNVNDDESEVWSILEQAASDDYHRVVYSLFGANEKGIRRPSRGIKDSSKNLLQIFVKRIQMKSLDHPTSLTARSWAWSLLDSDYCDINLVIEKARQLCTQFDKNSNFLWKRSFEKILTFHKLQKVSSENIVKFIQSIMYYEKEFNLSIYHRINNLLDLFISSIGEIDFQQRQCFRSFALSIFQFEITMAHLIGRLLMKLAQNKEDLEGILTVFQQYLPASYCEHILIKLALNLSANDGSCPFVEQLSIDEKFQLALWFINEKNQPLFVFDLLKNHVFNKTSIDKEQCHVLLSQMRQSKNLLLRQQALEYKDESINDDSK